jgi:hypothetical protein
MTIITTLNAGRGKTVGKKLQSNLGGLRPVSGRSASEKNVSLGNWNRVPQTALLRAAVRREYRVNSL